MNAQLAASPLGIDFPCSLALMLQILYTVGMAVGLSLVNTFLSYSVTANTIVRTQAAIKTKMKSPIFTENLALSSSLFKS